MSNAQTPQRRRRHLVKFRDAKFVAIKFVAIVAVLTLAASACRAQTTSTVKPQDHTVSTLTLQTQTAPGTKPEDLAKYRELMVELGPLFTRLSLELQFPPARSESRLLPLLPESTMSYAAFPNYGDVAHQALVIFRDEVQKNSALRDAWQKGDLATTGPKVLDSLEKFDQLSEYVGDEIVVSGAMEGRDPSLLIVAAVRKPGLKDVLQKMTQELAGKTKPGVRVLDPKELATAGDSSPARELVVLVRPDFVVAALDLTTLRGFSAQLDHKGSAFASTPFGQKVAQGYQGGATILAAADLHKILSLVPTGNEQDQATFQRSGFADMKYLVWDRTNVGGQGLSQAELSFTGPRHGVASWLAAPAPLGSLDFVSPKAIVAGTVVLKDPAQIFEDAKEIAAASKSDAFAALPFFEQSLKLSLKDDLLGRLGGEITGELDDFTPPNATWKAVLRVNDSSRLQQTLNTLLAFAHFTTEQSDEGGVTYHTVLVPSAKTPHEIGYAFVDGYLIVGSSREAVADAVRLHKSGESLGKSEKFLAALPPGHAATASGLLYEDLIAMVALQLRQIAPDMAKSFPLAAVQAKPVVSCAYGEETAIRESSTSFVADAGPMAVMAAIAIPNLLRSRAAANEASAVGSIRTLNTAQLTYAATYPERGFAPDLATLGLPPGGTSRPSADHASLIAAGLADASCTAGAWCTKAGFRFSLSAVCKQQLCKEYVVTSTPVASGAGSRSFCSTSDGVIRFHAGPPLTSPANVSECESWPPLQ